MIITRTTITATGIGKRWGDSRPFATCGRGSNGECGYPYKPL